MLSFEQKYCMGTNDRKFQFFWDISAMLKDFQTAQLSIKYYNVSDLFKTNPFFGNAEYAMSANVDDPCIIVRLTDNMEKLIDRNHRLYKAKQLGYDSIPCYVLPLDYHKRFIIDYDDNIYKSVVEDFF